MRPFPPLQPPPPPPRALGSRHLHVTVERECGGLCLHRSCRAPLVVRGLEEQDPLAVPGELRALTAKEFREQRTLRRACTSPLDGEVALRALGALGRDMSSTAARPKAQLRASVGVNYCRTSGQQADKETRIVLVAVDIVVVVVAIVEIYTVQPHNVYALQSVRVRIGCCCGGSWNCTDIVRVACVRCRFVLSVCPMCVRPV